jgi:hypothetical protein
MISFSYNSFILPPRLNYLSPSLPFPRQRPTPAAQEQFISRAISQKTVMVRNQLHTLYFCRQLVYSIQLNVPIPQTQPRLRSGYHLLYLRTQNEQPNHRVLRGLRFQLVALWGSQRAQHYRLHLLGITALMDASQVAHHHRSIHLHQGVQTHRILHFSIQLN